MLRSILGKSNDKPEESASSSRRRKDSESRSQQKDSESASPTSTRKARSDDRDRGFNPTSTSYSSTTRSNYAGTAAPSIASSYATAQTTRPDDSITRPDLVRTQSVTDQMPRTRSGRDGKEEKESKNGRRRDRSSSRDRKTRRDRSRSEERRTGEKKDKKIRRRNTDGEYSDYKGTTRAGEMDSFNTKIGGSGFTQFPGQYDAGTPGNVPGSSSRPHEMSNHVPDMFPGQFPESSTAPYRPPLSKHEGGPGLASDYYGDLGQSVSQQPGVRPQAPSLIVGAEPHLMPASAIAAPPPEPSASGGVGAAASFFSGASFESPSTSPKPSNQSRPHQKQPITDSTSNFSGPPDSRPSYASSGVSPMNTSGSIPTIGAAAIGAATGYAAANHSSSHHDDHYQRPQSQHTSNSQGNYVPLPSQPLPSQFNSSPHTNGRPSNPSKSPTPSSNLPYIAAAAGAAGLAASAYHHNHHGHHDSGHHDHYDSSHYYHSDQPLPGGSVAQKHRHKGPMSKFVDFFRDPEGVARFEEYTEYIGVCRYCFEPGSSPRDAPRKHKPKRKISNERFGSSTRIDKDSRYWSSDNDRHRRKNKSWVGAGIAGYGLTQVGKSLFGNNHDFDDTYSVQTGRNGSSTSIHQRRHSSPDYKSRVSRGSTSRHSSDLKSSSKIEVELGGHGKSHKHDSRDGRHGSAVVVSHSKRRSRSRSRSRSKDRKSKLTTAAVGAAVGSALLASSSKKKHSSPEKLEKLVLRRRHSRSNSSSSSSSSSGRRKSRSSRQSKAGSGIFGGFFTSPPPKQHSSHKKKKSVSFFSFGNSSSSSSEGLAYGTGSDHSKRKKSTTSKKINSASEANTALLGLGAAIGTLAAAENRNGSKGKRNGTVVAVKDSKNKSQKIYGHEPSKRKQAEILEDGWENVSEDSFSSADSGLAYGHGNRSSDSLSSSSGTDKWSWRWGSKQKKKRSPSPKHDRHYGTVAAVAGAAAAGAALASRNHHDASRDSNNSIPSLQHVHPEPIIDYGYDHRSGPLSQPPLNTSRPAPIPLQQPQPKPAVASSVYTSQAPYEPSYTSPSGPTVFADLRPDRPSRYDTPDDKDRDVMSDKKYRRRDPSPHVVTVEPRGSAVRFDLSEEQKDKSRRSDRKEERRLSKSDKPKRNSRDADDKAEDKERRKSKDSKKDREQGLDRVESERREVEELKRLKREFEQHEESMRRREEEEIREAERQREALYEAEKRKSSKESSSWKEPALAGIAGAAIVSSIAREASSKKSDDRRTRRSDDGRKVYHDDDRDYVKEKRRGEKPSRKDSKDSSGFAGIVGAAITKPAADADVDERRGREQSHPTAKDTREESDSRDVEQARRIAKKTAIHIKRSPSPVVHEDYSTFFAPAEILSKPAGDKERATSPDADNNVASYAVPGVVTAEPKQKFVFTGPDEDIKPDPDRIFPWRIPHLELIIPTPPVSRAPSVVPSVRSASPSNEPKHEKSEPEKSVKPSGKGVTFGKDETREFEVHSADEHHNDYDVHRKTTVESPEASEFSVREPRKDHASSQSSSWKEPALAGIAGAAIAATLARDSPSKKSKDRGDGDSDVERDVRPNKRAVEERPKQMPGQFDDDIDFTATVAAAMDATGFDSKIVEGDPTFRKRTSPPGSQEPPLNRRPISGSVAEFGFDSPGTKGVPSTRGWVAGKLPDTPNAGSQAASVEELDEKLSKKERKKREKTARRASKDVDLPLANDSRTPTRSEDLNDAELEIIEDASKEIPEESVTPSKSKKSKDKKSKRDSKSAETMIETKDEFHDAEEPSRAALASTRERDIPDEAWAVPLPNEDGSLNGTMSATRSEPRTEKSEPDFYDSPNEYAASVASVPMGDDYEDKKKHRKKSKRRSSGFDDTASVVSSPAQFDDSKDKSTDKREKKSGGIFGIFSKAVDDAADKRKAKPAASEPAEDVEETREKKKKHRKSRDGNDVYSLASDSVADLSRVDVEDPDEFREKKKKHRRSRDSSDVYSLASESVADLSRVDTEESGKSRKSKDKSERRKSRHDSRDEGETGRTTRDLPSKSRDPIDTDDDPPNRRSSFKNKDEPQSFLGVRRKITEPPDISGSEDDDHGGRLRSYRRSSSSPPTSRPLTPNSREGSKDDSYIPGRYTTPVGKGRDRRLSMIQTDIEHTPATTSPIPISHLFRKPSSAGGQRSISSTPMQSPSLTTPRVRKPRPQSTEFKSNEFRPLFLVERHQVKPDIDPEEVLPSLPSSHTTSRASSVHELDFPDHPIDQGSRPRLAALDLGAARDYNPDILDSQQATPTATTYQQAQEQANNKDKEQDILDQARQEAIQRELEWNQRHSGEFQRKDVEGSPKRITHRAGSFFRDHDRSPGRYGGARSSFAEDLGIAALAGGVAAAALGSSKDYVTSPHDSDNPIVIGSELGGYKSVTESREPFERPDILISNASKKKKGKKSRSSTKGSIDYTVPSTEPSTPATPSKDVTVMSLEDRQKLEEKDTQDAMDDLFDGPAPITDDRKKKGRKSRGQSLDQKMAQVTAPESKESETATDQLSKGMSASEVAAVMAASAMAEAALSSHDYETVSKDQSRELSLVASPTTKESTIMSPKSPKTNDILLSRSSSTKSKKGKKRKGSSVTTFEKPAQQAEPTDETIQSPIAETPLDAQPPNMVEALEQQPEDYVVDGKKSKKGKKNKHSPTIESFGSTTQDPTIPLVAGITAGSAVALRLDRDSSKPRSLDTTQPEQSDNNLVDDEETSSKMRHGDLASTEMLSQDPAFRDLVGSFHNKDYEVPLSPSQAGHEKSTIVPDLDLTNVPPTLHEHEKTAEDGTSRAIGTIDAKESAPAHDNEPQDTFVTPSQEATEEVWGFASTKKGKKGKKNKKSQSSLPATPLPEPAEGGEKAFQDPHLDTVQESTAVEALTPAEDEWAIPSSSKKKNTKKGKKGKAALAAATELDFGLAGEHATQPEEESKTAKDFLSELSTDNESFHEVGEQRGPDDSADEFHDFEEQKHGLFTSHEWSTETRGLSTLEDSLTREPLHSGQVTPRAEQQEQEFITPASGGSEKKKKKPNIFSWHDEVEIEKPEDSDDDMAVEWTGKPDDIVPDVAASCIEPYEKQDLTVEWTGKKDDPSVIEAMPEAQKATMEDTIDPQADIHTPDLAVEWTGKSDDVPDTPKHERAFESSIETEMLLELQQTKELEVEGSIIDGAISTASAPGTATEVAMADAPQLRYTEEAVPEECDQEDLFLVTSKGKKNKKSKKAKALAWLDEPEADTLKDDIITPNENQDMADGTTAKSLDEGDLISEPIAEEQKEEEPFGAPKGKKGKKAKKAKAMAWTDEPETPLETPNPAELEDITRELTDERIEDPPVIMEEYPKQEDDSFAAPMSKRDKKKAKKAKAVAWTDEPDVPQDILASDEVKPRGDESQDIEIAKEEPSAPRDIDATSAQVGDPLTLPAAEPSAIATGEPTIVEQTEQSHEPHTVIETVNEKVADLPAEASEPLVLQGVVEPEIPRGEPILEDAPFTAKKSKKDKKKKKGAALDWDPESGPQATLEPETETITDEQVKNDSAAIAVQTGAQEDIAPGPEDEGFTTNKKGKKKKGLKGQSATFFDFPEAETPSTEPTTDIEHILEPATAEVVEQTLENDFPTFPADESVSASKKAKKKKGNKAAFAWDDTPEAEPTAEPQPEPQLESIQEAEVELPTPLEQPEEPEVVTSKKGKNRKVKKSSFSWEDTPEVETSAEPQLEDQPAITEPEIEPSTPADLPEEFEAVTGKKGKKKKGKKTALNWEETPEAETPIERETEIVPEHEPEQEPETTSAKKGKKKKNKKSALSWEETPVEPELRRELTEEPQVERMVAIEDAVESASVQDPSVDVPSGTTVEPAAVIEVQDVTQDPMLIDEPLAKEIAVEEPTEPIVDTEMNDAAGLPELVDEPLSKETEIVEPDGRIVETEIQDVTAVPIPVDEPLAREVGVEEPSEEIVETEVYGAPYPSETVAEFVPSTEEPVIEQTFEPVVDVEQEVTKDISEPIIESLPIEAPVFEHTPEPEIIESPSSVVHDVSEPTIGMMPIVEPLQEIHDEPTIVEPPTPIAEEDTFAFGKKSKKKKGKKGQVAAWDDFEAPEEAGREIETPLESGAVTPSAEAQEDESTFVTGRKGKKKKGKKAQTFDWDAPAEGGPPAQEPTPVEELVAASEAVDEPPISKKGKKTKSKKAQSYDWEAPADTEPLLEESIPVDTPKELNDDLVTGEQTTVIPEPFEEPTNKKGKKKKNKKAQAFGWDDTPEEQRESENATDPVQEAEPSEPLLEQISTEPVPVEAIPLEEPSIADPVIPEVPILVPKSLEAAADPEISEQRDIDVSQSNQGMEPIVAEPVSNVQRANVFDFLEESNRPDDTVQDLSLETSAHEPVILAEEASIPTIREEHHAFESEFKEPDHMDVDTSAPQYTHLPENMMDITTRADQPIVEQHHLEQPSHATIPPSFDDISMSEPHPAQETIEVKNATEEFPAADPETEFLSTKKSKKKRAKKQAELDWEEPVTKNTPTPYEFAEPSDLADDPMQAVTPERSRDSFETVEPELVSSKKGKKGKKGKKATTFSWDEPEDPTSTTPDVFDEPTLLDTEKEPDLELFVSKKGKKSKKAKTSDTLDFDQPEETEIVEPAIVESETTKSPEVEAAEPEASLGSLKGKKKKGKKSQSFDWDELSEPTMPVAEEPEPIPVQETPTEDVQFFSTPKAKKNKKSKRTSVTWDDNHETLTYDADTPIAETPLSEKMDIDQEQFDSISRELGPPLETDQTSDTEESTKTKSKKDKKKKKAQAFNWDDEPETLESIDRSLAAEDSVAVPETIAEPAPEDELFTPKKNKKDKKKKKSQAFAWEEESAEAPLASEEQLPDDGPVREGVPVHFNEPDYFPEYAPSSARDILEPAPEDIMAVIDEPKHDVTRVVEQEEPYKETNSKKRKKGKKSKKTAATAFDWDEPSTPAPEEPSVLTEEIAHDHMIIDEPLHNVPLAEPHIEDIQHEIQYELPPIHDTEGQDSRELVDDVPVHEYPITLEKATPAESHEYEIVRDTPEIESEGEFAFATTKRARKGKKNTRKNTLGPETEEAVVSSRTVGDIYRHIDETPDFKQPIDPVCSTSDVPTPTEGPPTAETEEDWASFGSKKKKSKKAKKQSLAIWEDEVSTSAGLEEAIASEPVHIPGDRSFEHPIVETSESVVSREIPFGPIVEPTAVFGHEHKQEGLRSPEHKDAIGGISLAAAAALPAAILAHQALTTDDQKHELEAEADWVFTTTKATEKQIDASISTEHTPASRSPILAPVEETSHLPTPPQEFVEHEQRYEGITDEPEDMEIVQEHIDKATEEPTEMEIIEHTEKQGEPAPEEDIWGPRIGKKVKKNRKASKEQERDESEVLPEFATVNAPVSRSASLKGTAKTVGTVGAGIALFEAADGAKKKKKRKGSKAWEAEEDTSIETKQEDELVARGITAEPFEAPRGHIEDSITTRDREKYINRDSAVHITDSPRVPESLRHSYNIRDSGYQGTEASPVFAQESGRFDDTMHAEESPRDFDASGIPSTNRSSATTSEHPLNIQIEVDPDYDVQVSSPTDGHRMSLSRSTYAEDEDHDAQLPPPFHESHRGLESPGGVYNEREPSPIDSTTKDRSATLFGSSPSTREDPRYSHARHQSMDEISTPRHQSRHQRDVSHGEENVHGGQPRSLFGGPVGLNSDFDAMRSPPRTPVGFDSASRPLTTITEASPDSPLAKKSRAVSDVGEPEQGIKVSKRSETPQSILKRSSRSKKPKPLEPISTDDIISRMSWPEVDEETQSVDLERSRSRTVSRDGHRVPSDPTRHHDGEFRTFSGQSIRSNDSINAIIRSPATPKSSTPPLRRSDRSVSSDLRTASRRSQVMDASDDAKRELDAKALSESELEADLSVVASSSTNDPRKDKGKARIIKMTDVYQGWGDVQGSPRSPTRPPSMRRRQSMQILDLESRLDQLLAENRSLQDAKNRAERSLDEVSHDHSQQSHALNEAVETRDLYLRQKNEELDQLKETLQGLQTQLSHLTEVNQTLESTRSVDDGGYETRYKTLEAEFGSARQHWEDNTRELDELRTQHNSLSSGMEHIVAHEIALAVQGKDSELEHLRKELESAQQHIRSLKQQILASRKADDFLVARDEDYFDVQCQKLCQHVQQWVLRFSKFSDSRLCRRMADVKEEKMTDRFDNAILDGSDVDIYLADRVKRRDVFMSVVMTMVWEYIFTRYLFGMDREQRSKLKNLEKTLTEVGPPAAVNKWRATTLSMLSKREAFQEQRGRDTEAVVHEIYDTLAGFLPPPAHLIAQIQDSLRKVMQIAVDLSIEMRTQKAEYIMLPPLQPEYDENGDLARKVYFNASTMNERSGDTASNDDLAANHEVVRIVLFPLVVMRGDEDGTHDEDIVVCPAQVLVAREDAPKPGGSGRKSVRVVSAQGNRSVGSFAAPSASYLGEGGMI